MFSTPSTSWHDQIELDLGPVIPILSKAIRSQFIADKGKRLYGGDFSNIEGRINAWFAGEQWKLDAFRAYDDGRGPDLYKLAFARAFGRDLKDVGRPERQVGKTQELAFGYQGSVGAWLRFDPRPDDVVRVTKDYFDKGEAWRKAAGQYDASKNHLGLTADQWIAIKVNVNSWREANARIVQGWWDLQDAAIMAVDNPEAIVPVYGGKAAYMASEGFLWCRLPSGKMLAYAKPRIVERKEKWLVDADGEPIDAEEMEQDEIDSRVAQGATLEEGGTRTQVAFEGKSQKGQWGRQYLYGGLQCNNIIQGTARELLRFAMLNLEEAGYPLVLHVHDETVSEVDSKRGSVAEYEALMKIVPPWLDGLPLAAKAWTDLRYVK